MLTNSIIGVFDILAGLGRLMSEEQNAEPCDLGGETGSAEGEANSGRDLIVAQGGANETP